MTAELMLVRCTAPGTTIEDVGAAISFVASMVLSACRLPDPGTTGPESVERSGTGRSWSASASHH